MDVKTWFEKEIDVCIRADGGWLELTEIAEDTVKMTAKGECAHCAALDRCIQWVQTKAKQELGLELCFSVSREPFLWRK